MTQKEPYGGRVLDLFRQQLGLEDEYVLDQKDGYSWWPGKHAIRFRWAAPEEQSVPLPAWRISFELDAIERVDADAAQQAAILAMATKTWNLFSTVVEDGIVRFRGTVFLLEGGNVAPMVELINRAFFASFVACEKAPDLVGALSKGRRSLFRRGGARLAMPQHPSSGRRRTPSSLPDSFVSQMIEAGRSPSPADRRPDVTAASRALREVGLKTVQAHGHDPAGSNSTGLNAVIETKDATSLLDIRLDEPNPSVGRGMLAVLRVRFPEGHLHGTSEQLATELNREEWTRRTPMDLSGAWTANAAGSDVAFSSFSPNSIHHPELARKAALDGVRRARWVFNHFGYEDPFTPEGPYGRIFTGAPEPTGLRS